MDGLTRSRRMTEREWQRDNAARFRIRPDGVEVVLWDDSRVDWLDDEYAYEIDWSHKWTEAIGQATWYAILTNRKPAVVLICRDRAKEQEQLHKAAAVCSRLNIRLIIEPEGL